jgi:hypothetical protein
LVPVEEKEVGVRSRTMAQRKMPDGSLLDTETGVLSNYDVARENSAREIARRSGSLRGQNPANTNQGTLQQAPTMNSPNANRGQQMTPVVMVPGPHGPQPIIRPSGDVLAVKPFELGMGAMSDTTKKVLLIGLVVGGAFGAVWLGNKLKGKKKSAKGD